MRRAAILAWVVWATGCMPLPQMSSGPIGCPPGDITVSEQQSKAGGATWTAQCHGRTYYCSWFGGDGATTSCSPADRDAATPEIAAPTQSEGCSYDTQCKGSRVCEAGRCVEASGAPEPAPPEPTPAPEPAPIATPPAG